MGSKIIKFLNCEWVGRVIDRASKPLIDYVISRSKIDLINLTSLYKCFVKKS